MSNGVKIIFIGIYGGRLLFQLVNIHSRKYTECSDFMLLFCRGRLRNVPSFIMPAQSHYSANQSFYFTTFSFPLPSWFAKGPYSQKARQNVTFVFGNLNPLQKVLLQKLLTLWKEKSLFTPLPFRKFSLSDPIIPWNFGDPLWVGVGMDIFRVPHN